MNAVTPTLHPAISPQLFADATARVNEWRGRCIDAFARAEAATTGCLMALAETKERGDGVRLPHLIGQRFEALADMFAADAPFAAEAGGALAAVEVMKARLHLRTMLCHGVGRVTLDRNGRWTLVLNVETLRSRRTARETLALTEAEAEQLGDDIRRASRALCMQLGQVRARLQPQARS